MKSKLFYLCLFSCLFLIPTSLYIIVNINYALYAKDPESMTYYKRAADFMGFGYRVKLFYMCIGSGLTWLVVLAWDWVKDWKLFKQDRRIIMNDLIEKLLAFIYCFTPTLYFIGLKSGIFTRGGWPYNWQGDVPHTMWFLLILSINMLEYLFILHWQYGLFNRERYQ